MTWSNWVIDASLDDPSTGVFCFCPVEGDLAGEHSIVFGMNILTDKPPHGGKLVGIVHQDGQEAVERWIQQNRGRLDKLKQG